MHKTLFFDLKNQGQRKYVQKFTNIMIMHRFEISQITYYV